MEYPGRRYCSIISYRSVLQVSSSCHNYWYRSTAVRWQLYHYNPRPRYPQSDAPISNHIKQVYCNVDHVRGYPMNMIPAIIRPYLPFYPPYEADNCSFVILMLCCIDCTQSQPLNLIFCQSSQLGTALHCQFSRRLDC